jgi:hypothetical protein
MNLKKIILANIIVLLVIVLIYQTLPNILNIENTSQQIGYTFAAILILLVVGLIVITYAFIKFPAWRDKILHTEKQLNLKPVGEIVRKTIVKEKLCFTGGAPEIRLVPDTDES